MQHLPVARPLSLQKAEFLPPLAGVVTLSCALFGSVGGMHAQSRHDKTTHVQNRQADQAAALLAEMRKLRKESEERFRGQQEEILALQAALQKQARESTVKTDVIAPVLPTPQPAQAAEVVRPAPAVTVADSKRLDTLQRRVDAMQQQAMTPDVLRYKGIAVSLLGSSLDLSTIYRSAATGSDGSTPLLSIPLASANGAQISEFFASARRSKIGVLAEGKLDRAVLRGYYEFDFLASGTTSNNNNLNGYVPRQRILLAQALLNSGWGFHGGQMWTLATENRAGIDPRTVPSPQTIDSIMHVGFVWARQPGFMVTRSLPRHLTAGVSLEQAQTLAPGCSASTGGICPVNYLFGTYINSGKFEYVQTPFPPLVAGNPSLPHFQTLGQFHLLQTCLFTHLS